MSVGVVAFEVVVVWLGVVGLGVVGLGVLAMVLATGSVASRWRVGWRNGWVTARARVGAAGESGQTTAEYALVIVGAAAVAGLLIAWAAQSHAISKLFDVVIGRITKQ